MDEKEWVIQISNSILNKECPANDIKTPVCIYQVPQSTKATKPDAYTPQVVALGPYHQLRTKTDRMQLLKLSAALRFHKHFVWRCRDMSRDDFFLRELGQIKIPPEQLAEMISDAEFILPDEENSEQISDTEVLPDDQELPQQINDTEILPDDQELPEQSSDTEVLPDYPELPEEISDTEILPDDLELPEQFKLEDIQNLFNLVKEEAQEIRASYHESLPIQDETLSWMMLIDGLFLLALIDKDHQQWIFNLPPDKVEQSLSEDPSSDSPNSRATSTERSSLLDAIIKDVVLLENQIPKIVFEALLMSRSSKHITDDILVSQMLCFCKRLSPIEMRNFLHNEEIEERFHLLDILHQLVWLKPSILLCALRPEPIHIGEFKTSIGLLLCMIENMNGGLGSIIAAVADFTSNILDLLGKSITGDVLPEEEVLIPSASQLSRLGVKFIGKVGGIKEFTTFCEKKGDEGYLELTLPVLNPITPLTEVVIRNLLAYEAEAMPHSPKFSRYIEFMAGLMPTVSDVELLKIKPDGDYNERVVPENANSEEVVKLFSSMKEAIGSKGKCEVLDDTIKKVNEYYNGCNKVKGSKLAKKCCTKWRKILNVLVLIMVTVLLVMQMFCSIYGCSNIFNPSD